MIKKYLTLLCGVLCGSSVCADFYGVHGVNVNAVGENPTMAKQTALEQGQQVAFNQVVRRLVGPGVTFEVDGADIVNLVQDLSILDEKNTLDQYWGTIDVRFKPKDTQAYLESHHQSVLQNEPPKLLLVPILNQTNAIIGLEDANTFFQWLRMQNQLSDFYDLVLPAGDLDEMVLVNQALTNQNMSSLLNLAHRYGAEAAVVVKARSTPSDSWRLESQWVGEKDLPYQNIAINSWYGLETLPEAWQELMDKMEHAWRLQDAEAMMQDQVYYARLDESGLSHWVMDEAALKKLDFIEDLTLQGTYHHQMLISFRFKGTRTELSDSWRQAGWIWSADLTGPSGTLKRAEVYYDE